MQPEPTELPLWGPTDPATVSDVTAVDADWRREADRARIDSAIERVAMRDGKVSPNAVRSELLDAAGNLDVNPRTLSARYMALSHAGVLRWDGEWTTLQDRSGNSGKPTRLYVYLGAA